MDTKPEHKPEVDYAALAALKDEGYTCSRLGLVPCNEEREPSFVPHSSPTPAAPPPPPPRPASPVSRPPSPLWQTPVAAPLPAHSAPVHPVAAVAAVAAHKSEDNPKHEEDFVRVTVKVPRALRDILRSYAKNTHQFQYVLVIEALADFVVHLPEDVQRQLLRDINDGNHPPHPPAHRHHPHRTFWKRWLKRLVEKSS